MNIDKIKSLIDKTYSGELMPDEVRASDIYKSFPEIPTGTTKYRLQNLVRLGKLSSRKLPSGEFVYKQNEEE